MGHGPGRPFLSSLGNDLPWIAEYALIYLHWIDAFPLQYGIHNVRDEVGTWLKMLASMKLRILLYDLGKIAKTVSFFFNA